MSKRTKKTTINDIDTTALLKLIEINEKEEQSEYDQLKKLTDEELRKLAIKYALELIEEEQSKRKRNK